MEDSDVPQYPSDAVSSASILSFFKNEMIRIENEKRYNLHSMKKLHGQIFWQFKNVGHESHEEREKIQSILQILSYTVYILEQLETSRNQSEIYQTSTDKYREDVDTVFRFYENRFQSLLGQHVDSGEGGVIHNAELVEQVTTHQRCFEQIRAQLTNAKHNEDFANALKLWLSTMADSFGLEGKESIGIVATAQDASQGEHNLGTFLSQIENYINARNNIIDLFRQWLVHMNRVPEDMTNPEHVSNVLKSISEPLRQVAQLQEQLNQQANELKAASEYIRVHRVSLEQANAQKEAAQAELGRVQKEIKVLQEKMKALNKDYVEAQETLRIDKQNLDRLATSYKNLEQEKARIEQSLTVSNQVELDSYQKQLEGLRVQLDKKQEELEAARKEYEENNTSNEEALAQLNEEIANMRTGLITTARSAGIYEEWFRKSYQHLSLDAFREIVTQKTAEWKAQKKYIEQLKETTDEYVGKERQLNEQLLAAQTTITNLRGQQAQLEAIQVKMKESQDGLERQNRELRVALGVKQELEVRIKSLDTELRNSRRGKDEIVKHYERAKAQIAELEERIESLENKMRNSRISYEQNMTQMQQSLQSKTHECEQNAQACARHLAEKDSELAQLRNEISTLEEQKTDFQQLVDKSKREYEILQARMINGEKVLKDLEAQRTLSATLESELEAKTSEYETRTAEAAKLEKEVSTLRTELEAEKKRAEQAEKDMRALNDRNEALENTAVTREMEFKDLEQELTITRRRVEELENSQTTTQREKQNILDENTNFKNRIEQLHRVHAEQLDEKQKMIEEKAELDEKLRLTRQQIEETEISLESKQKKLESTIHELRIQTEMTKQQEQHIRELDAKLEDYKTKQQLIRQQAAKLQENDESLESLQSQNKELSLNIQALQKTYDVALQTLRQEKRAIAEKENTIKQLNQRISKSDIQTQILKRRMKELQDQLRSKDTTIGEMNAQITQLNDSLRNLRQENLILGAQYTDMQNTLAQAEESEQDLNTRLEQMEQAANITKARLERQIAERDVQINTIQQKIKQIEEQLRHEQGTNEALGQQKEELTATLQRFRETNEDSIRRHQLLLQEKNQLEQQFETLTAEHEKQKADLETNIRENQELRAKIEAQRTEMETQTRRTQTMEATLADSTAETTRIRSEKDELQKQYDDLVRELERQRNQTAQSINALGNQILDLKHDAQRVQKETHDYINGLFQKFKLLPQDAVGEASPLTRLDQALKEMTLESQVSNAKVEDLLRQNEDYQRRLKDLKDQTAVQSASFETERMNAKQELQNAREKFDQSMTELSIELEQQKEQSKQVIDELKEKIRILEEQLRASAMDHENDLRQIRDAQVQSTRLDAQLQNLRKSLREKEKQLENLSSKHQKFQEIHNQTREQYTQDERGWNAQKEQLVNQITDLQAQVNTLRREKEQTSTSIQQQIEQLDAEKARLVQEKVLIDGKLQEVTANFKSTKGQVESLRRGLSDAQEAKVVIEQELQQALNKIEEYIHVSQQWAQQKAHLEQQMRTIQSEGQRAVDQVQISEQQIKSIQNQLEETQEQSNATIRELNAQMATLRGTANTQQQTIDSLTTRVRSLEASVQSIETEKEGLSKRISTLETEKLALMKSNIALEEQVRSFEERLGIQEEQHNALSTRIATLTQENKSQAADLERQKHVVDTLRDRLKIEKWVRFAVQRALRAKEKQVHELQQRIVHTDQVAAEYTERFNELMKRFEQEQQRAKENQSRAEEHQSKNESLEQKLKALQRTAEEVVVRENSIREKLENTYAEIQRLHEELEATRSASGIDIAVQRNRFEQQLRTKRQKIEELEDTLARKEGEKKTLERRQRGHEQEVGNLRAQILLLNTKLREKDAQMEEFRHKNDSLVLSLRGKSKELDRIVSERQKLYLEIQKLERMMLCPDEDEGESKHRFLNPGAVLQQLETRFTANEKQLEKITREHDRLLNESGEHVKTLENNNRELQTNLKKLEDRYNDIQDQNTRLKREIEGITMQTNDQEGMNQSLRLHVDKMKEQLLEKDETIRRVLAEKGDLETKLRESETGIEQLRREQVQLIDAHQKEIEEFQRQVRSGNEKIQEAQSRAQTLEEEKQGLSNELENLRSTIARVRQEHTYELQHKVAYIEGLTTKLNNKERQLGTMRKELMKLEVKTKDSEELKTSILQAQFKHLRVKLQLDIVRKCIARIESETEAEKAVLAEKIRHLESKNHTLHQKIQTHEAQLSQKTQEIQDLEARLHRNNIELESIKTNLAARTRSYEHVQMQKEDMENKVKEIENDNTALRAQLEAMRFSEEEHEETNRSLREELRRNNAEIEKLTQNLRDTQVLISRFERDKVDRENEVSTLKSEAETYRREKVVIEEELKNLQRQIQLLEKKLQQQQTTFDTERNDYESLLHSQKAGMQAYIQRVAKSLEDERGLLHAKIKELEAELEIQRQATRNEREKHERSKKIIEEQTTEIEHMEREHATLQTLIEKLRIENEDQQARNHREQEELANTYTRELHQLQQQIQRKEQKHREDLRKQKERFESGQTTSREQFQTRWAEKTQEYESMKRRLRRMSSILMMSTISYRIRLGQSQATINTLKEENNQLKAQHASSQERQRNLEMQTEELRTNTISQLKKIQESTTRTLEQERMFNAELQTRIQTLQNDNERLKKENGLYYLLVVMLRLLRKNDRKKHDEALGRIRSEFQQKFEEQKQTISELREQFLHPPQTEDQESRDELARNLQERQSTADSRANERLEFTARSMRNVSLLNTLPTNPRTTRDRSRSLPIDPVSDLAFSRSLAELSESRSQAPRPGPCIQSNTRHGERRVRLTTNSLTQRPMHDNPTRTSLLEHLNIRPESRREQNRTNGNPYSNTMNMPSTTSTSTPAPIQTSPRRSKLIQKILLTLVILLFAYVLADHYRRLPSFLPKPPSWLRRLRWYIGLVALFLLYDLIRN